MTYYGQFDPPTDKVIEEYFPNQLTGIAIEVGAAHGIAASNSLHFEQLGWKCLCIEPNPNLFAQLRMNRKHVLNYAVSSFNEDCVDFTICTRDETAVSALTINQKLYEENNSPRLYTIKVDVRTLDYCLKDFSPPIDFVSIDTEGTELDVLKGFSLDIYKPKLLVIENNFNSPYIEDYLFTFEYKKDRRHVINDFFTR